MFPRFDPWFLLVVSTTVKNGYNLASGRLALPAKAHMGNLEQCIQARKNKKRNNAPLFCMLFKAFHTEGPHYNMYMPFAKSFPVVEAISFVNPRFYFFNNAINLLNK